MHHKKLNINFENLCQLPHRMHVYWTDNHHKIKGSNSLQMQVNEKLCGIKNIEDLKGLTLIDLYQKNKERGYQLCNENEEVLKSQKTLFSSSTLVIPDILLIEFKTEKFPCYGSQGKASGVIGISYYVREIILEEANYFNLTSRELDCLDCLLMNKTAKETALFLSLSQRTVEDYLDKAKHKLNCQTKAELIAKLKDLNFIRRYMK